MDPPAFTKGKEKEVAERTAATQGDRDEEQEPQRVEIIGKKAKEKKRKGKRKRNQDTDEEDNILLVVQEPRSIQSLDPSMLNNSILTGALTPPNEDFNIDPALLR